MIKLLCEKYTDLKDDDIKEIIDLSEYLALFCELAEADLFIDCFSEDNEKGIVVAHGKPLENSQYQNNIQGEIVLPENEPIVFFTMKTGKPIRDAKGFTQEGRYVFQRTVPIRNKDGKTIGVLVKESDITKTIQAKRKLNQIEQNGMFEYLPQIINHNEKDEDEVVGKFAMLQEMHHRIKNNLQIISSILSMQERRSYEDETKMVLKDNISRINNIAQIHESLMNSHEKNLELNYQISILAQSMMNYANGEGKNIIIKVSGDDIEIDTNKIFPVLMVVNELLTNSIRHGYPDRTNGTIEINLVRGNTYSTIIVQDDGVGMSAKEKETDQTSGLGNELMNMMIKEDLKGSFHVDYGAKGTCAYFDFMM